MLNQKIIMLNKKKFYLNSLFSLFLKENFELSTLFKKKNDSRICQSKIKTYKKLYIYMNIYMYINNL